MSTTLCYYYLIIKTKGLKMTLQEIKEKLADRNVKLVALAIGVHPNTLYNIVKNNNAPRHSTYQKLVEYLK